MYLNMYMNLVAILRKIVVCILTCKYDKSSNRLVLKKIIFYTIVFSYVVVTVP